jgi:hypothetical protein
VANLRGPARLESDRFQLKIHFEKREGPVYALVVDKKGPKVKPSTAAGTYDFKLEWAAGNDGKPPPESNQPVSSPPFRNNSASSLNHKKR